MQKNNSAITITLLIIAVVVIVYFVFFHKKTVTEIPPVQTGTPVTTTPYNSALTTTYITAQGTWPPAVGFSNATFSCSVGGNQNSQNGITAEKTINGKEYCVTMANEGTAGSTYTTYTYKTEIGSQLATTTFVLRSVDCGNYSDPQMSACTAEQASFSPDTVADGLIEHAGQ